MSVIETIFVILGISAFLLISALVLGFIKGYTSNNSSKPVVSKRIEIITCIECGNKLESEMLFCPKCGKNTTEEAINPAPALNSQSLAESTGNVIGHSAKGLKNVGAIFVIGLLIWALGTGLFFHGLVAPYNPNKTYYQITYYASETDRNTSEIAFGAGISIFGFGLTVAGGIGLLRKRK